LGASKVSCDSLFPDSMATRSECRSNIITCASINLRWHKKIFLVHLSRFLIIPPSQPFALPTARGVFHRMYTLNYPFVCTLHASNHHCISHMLINHPKTSNATTTTYFKSASRGPNRLARSPCKVPKPSIMYMRKKSVNRPVEIVKCLPPCMHTW